jgi:multidrug efflux pump subunit AcrA (membrane-fusion protein)
LKSRAIFIAPAIIVPLAVAGFGAYRYSKTPVAATSPGIPSTTVKRGDVTFTVTARGELQGGKSEMLTAPMTGGNDMIVTYLREPGDVVKEGDMVARFDTTEQSFKLKEAEADLAESEQQVLQAQADSKAKEEESRYLLLQAKADLRQAELEARRNPLIASITARQNDLAVEAARDHLRQVEHDLGNQQATNAAAIAIQEAARNKAKVQADTAKRNIDSMTLKAHSGGYVSIQANTNGNFMFFGMSLPMLQVGDTVRAGMGVVQIPDLKNWEVSARIGELDRGHLAEKQKVAITVVALPRSTFTGSIKNIGGTTGPPWDRHFDCKIALDNPSAELRPGMTANVVITTEVLKSALWVPSQAVFESDGRSFVYLQSPSGYTPHDVKVVRRSESQVALTGVNDGQVVAMSNPGEQSQKSASGGGAMKAIGK